MELRVLRAVVDTRIEEEQVANIGLHNAARRLERPTIRHFALHVGHLLEDPLASGTKL